MKVVATYSIKGGVGKTSAAVNLAALAANEGHRTLMWDLDPQAAATFLFRIKPQVKGGGQQARTREARSARVDEGHGHRRARPAPRRLLLPASGPPAGRAQAAAGRLAGCWTRSRRVRPGDPGLRAVDLAGLGGRVPRQRPAARPDRPGDPLRAHVRAAPALPRRPGRPAARRARVPLDGRPAQAAASRAGVAAAAAARRRGHRVPPPASSSGWACSREPVVATHRAARPPRPTWRCGPRCATRSTRFRRRAGGRAPAPGSRAAAAAAG